MRVREVMRISSLPRMTDWTRRTLDAIKADRESEDYAHDPDARDHLCR